MSIKAIIIAVIAVAVVGGGGYYFATKDDNKQDNSESQHQSSLDVGENSSIKDLLASGQDIKCTYSYTDDKGYDSSGTTYISGNKIRGSFSVETEKGAQNSNLLQDDQYQYVWQDNSDTGFKTKKSALKSEDSENSKNEDSQTVDQDKKYDFDCSEWSVDQSVFQAPDNVKFTDYSKQIEQSQQFRDSARDQQEAACENLSGQARDACESAL